MQIEDGEDDDDNKDNNNGGKRNDSRMKNELFLKGSNYLACHTIQIFVDSFYFFQQ